MCFPAGCLHFTFTLKNKILSVLKIFLVLASKNIVDKGRLRNKE